MGYAELYFGHADAKTESIRQPESFVKSFVDHGNVIEAVVREGRFLVLGPKGTGKSALAAFLTETGERNALFVQTRDATELPMSEVNTLKTGDDPGISRSLNGWRFLLLCTLLEVVRADPNSRVQSNDEAMFVAGQLADYGFLKPVPREAILRANKVTWKVPLPAFGAIAQRESVTSLHLANMIPYLEGWIADEGRGGVQHLVVLDGLDSIYLNDKRYIPAITALVQSVLNINQELERRGGKARIVVLLRNDVFSRLDLPDGGKLREDWAIELDWRQLSGQAEDAPLFGLVDDKAVSLLSKEPFDVVRRHFPSKVRLGKQGAEREIHNYLLNLTRHTPRDLLRLFEHIRKIDAQTSAAGRSVILRPEVIREGVLQYSTKYFVDAIRNELVGRGVSRESGQAVVDGLRGVRNQRFTAEVFARSYRDASSGLEGAPSVEEALKWLFFAGALGNEVPGRTENYLQFFHRRDDNEVYSKGTLVLHNALVHAWGLQWA